MDPLSAFCYPGRYEMIVDKGLPQYFYGLPSEADEYGISYYTKPYGLVHCTKCGHEQQVVVADPYTPLGLETLKCDGCGKISMAPVVDFKPWVGLDFPLFGPPQFVEPKLLWEEIVAFLHESVFYPDDDYYSLVATWIMMTWRIREMHSVSYLAFVGPFSSGKTYSLEVLQQLAYHPILTVSESPAALVLDIKEYDPTLLIDQAENQLSTKFESGELMYRIVAAGYRKGAKYRRRVEGKMENVSYETFCPKALSSTKIWDSAINSRCYALKMTAADRLYVLDYDKAFDLRSKLFGWSLGGLEHVPLPATKTDLIGRQRDLAMGLSMVLEACALPEVIKSIEELTANEWKNLMDVATIEDFSGIVVSMIYDIILEKASTWNHTMKDILFNEQGDNWVDIDISVDEVYNKFGRENITKTRISRELTAIGITRGHKSGSRRYFKVGEHRELLFKLFVRYQLIGTDVEDLRLFEGDDEGDGFNV